MLNTVVNGVELFLFGTAIIYGGLIFPRSKHSAFHKVMAPLTIAAAGFALPWTANLLVDLIRDANLFG